MTHTFEFGHRHRLDTSERRRILPPEPILRKLGLKEGMTMADIGCGTGYFTFPAATIVGPQGFVWGADIEPRFIEENERRAKHMNIMNIRFVVSERTQVPLNGATVDAALASIVFHELGDDDKEAYLRELGRIIRPDGTIWIIEWKKDKAVMGPPFEERLGPEDIKPFAGAAGLRVQNVDDLSPSHYAVTLHK